MIKEYINKVTDRQPEYRFTGNLFNRYPELLNYAPLKENTRIWLSLTPIQRSWYFIYNDKPFNFYPIFLKLATAEKRYISVCKHISVNQAANCHKK